MSKWLSFFILLFSLHSVQGALNESEKPSQLNVYLEQNSPYSAFNNAQSAQGLLVDYWQQWSRWTGITVKYHPYLNQDLSLLSSDKQPAVYNGLQATPKALTKIEKQPLFVINSRFYYLSTRNNDITSALLDKKSPITVGGLLPQAQQLTLFSTTTNISYNEYSGLLELLTAIYDGQIDALVLFEGEQENITFLNWFLSLLFDEKRVDSPVNEVFVYIAEEQKVVLEWIDWGNQLENMVDGIGLAVEKTANPVWGISSAMQTRLLSIVGFVLLFVIFILC